MSEEHFYVIIQGNQIKGRYEYTAEGLSDALCYKNTSLGGDGILCHLQEINGLTHTHPE